MNLYIEGNRRTEPRSKYTNNPKLIPPEIFGSNEPVTPPIKPPIATTNICPIINNL